MAAAQQHSQPIWEENDDDDVPLGLGSLAPSALRRSHTHGGAYKRIPGASNGQPGNGSGNGSGSTSPGYVASSQNVGGSLGVSRRHSQKRAIMTRVLQQAAEEEQYDGYHAQEQHHDHTNVPGTLLEQDEAADRALYSPGQTGLARHSSMPQSRVRRGNNPGAPWNRAADELYPSAPSGDLSTLEHRMRSNSSTAAETSLPLHQPNSPAEPSFRPSSFGNSGFSVLSRPPHSMTIRTSAGHPSGSMHGRSQSSTGWSASPSVTAGSGPSPSRSRHASESLAGTPTYSGLPRSGPSTPPPASPIDAAILGANNPWSPTAEEKQHFKQFSNVPHHHHANLADGENGQINQGSPRRSNSLTATVGSQRARALAEGGRQATRKNTPNLPPLVTSPDALYNAATKQDKAATQTAHPLPSRPLQPQGPEVTTLSMSAAQQANPDHSRRPHPQSNSTRILRGPASAAPYVPPIGHTHSGNARQPSFQPQLDGLPHQAGRMQGADKTLNTAGPGIPQASFYRDRERIVGLMHDRSSPASAHPLASAISPSSAFSTSTMQFPSLNNPSSAAAFSNNLAMQQHLLAQQTAQLQDQQAQLAAALQSGLSLQDLPASLIQPPPSQGLNSDPYAFAARIDALQKANVMLAANGADGAGQQAPPTFGGLAPFSPPPPTTATLSAVLPTAGIMSADVAALVAEKGYNPREFNTRPAQARFFVIKSFTEDDVFKSIKFEIWSSTALGNNRLDKAHKESADKGPIYLFFSVNASGHFCGVAEMLTPLDYAVSSNVWAQNDKWKGVMKLRWIFIRDIPNPALRHLKLTNTNEQKPVTASRDTQEVPYEQGCEMLRIFHSYQSKTSLLQDYTYYQQQTERTRQLDAGSPHVQPTGPTDMLNTPGFTPAPYYQSQFANHQQPQHFHMQQGYNSGPSQQHAHAQAVPLRR